MTHRNVQTSPQYADDADDDYYYAEEDQDASYEHGPEDHLDGRGSETDSELSQEEEQTIEVLETVLERLLAYMTAKRSESRPRDSSVRTPSEADDSNATAGGRGRSVGSDEMTSPADRRTPRASNMDAYVSSRVVKDGDAPQWIRTYNDRKRHAADASQTENNREASSSAEPRATSAEAGPSERGAPNTARSGGASSAYSRQSSKYSVASQFLTEEEREERAKARRKKVEEEVASQRPFTPRLSRPGTPRRIAEVPLSAPHAWEDRLYKEYAARKKKQEEENKKKLAAEADEFGMEEFVRHCTFHPQINPGSMLITRAEDGETIHEAMYRRARAVQAEAATWRRQKEMEEEQKRRRLKNFKPSEDDVFSKLYAMNDEHLRKLRESRDAHDALIRGERTKLTDEEKEQLSNRLYEESKRREEHLQQLHDDLLKRASDHFGKPKLTPHHSHGNARQDTPAHERLYGHAVDKLLEARRQELAKLEAVTKHLTTPKKERSPPN